MRTQDEIKASFAEASELSRFTSFFLVGIGGAGMSALARMLKHRGFAVRGTDSTQSPATDALLSEGIHVHIGHTGDPISASDGVILTDAIDLKTSPEVAKALELGLPLFRRSQALGWVLRNNRVIAVTGTHGKTTTTGMTGAGAMAAGLDPLIVVGASVPQWGSPVVEGNGDWAVVEACEAYDSFHDLNPEVVVLTNLEPDHLDYHKSYENLRETVVRFCNKGKHLVFCASDPGAVEVAGLVNCETHPYSESEFKSDMILPGSHNRSNAAAAISALKLTGTASADAIPGIAAFTGAERRMQILRQGEITVIDDYAHHPTEIEMSLKGIRAKHPGRLVVVYQPHLYSRTKDWIPEFAKALDLADYVVLTDIYPAREDPIPGISSGRIAELITKPCRYVPSRHWLAKVVSEMAQPGDVIVGMGAGNIADFAPALIKRLDDQHQPARRPRVTVLFGGDSSEREVSLHSGRAVFDSLERQGYLVAKVDLTDWLMGRHQLPTSLVDPEPDVCFLAVHGNHAEDGAIQGFLELMGLPYTGSGIQASAMAMDKALTKQLLIGAGLSVARGQLVRSLEEPIEGAIPLIVKPNSEGSTVGLSHVEHDSQLRPALEKALAYGGTALVEEWVVGTEISVPVLGDRAMPVVEIVPASGKYDFASKYTVDATQEICPARLSEEMTRRVQDYALRAHQALRCQGATRTDMIIRGDDVVILEVNTLPGMTPTSLLPNSAKTAGMSFDSLVDWIVQDALVRSRAKS